MATVPLPRLVVGITVPTTANLVLEKTGVVQATLAVPAGTYWPDPIYGGEHGGNCLKQAGSPDVFGEIAQLADAAFAGQAPFQATLSQFAANYVGGGAPLGMPGWMNWFLTPASSTFLWNMAAGGANSAGRELARRIGLYPTGKTPLSYVAAVNGDVIVSGYWDAPRGQSGEIDHRLEGYSKIAEAYDGTTYASDLGPALQRRTLVFTGLIGPAVFERVNFPETGDLQGVYGFASWEAVMAEALMKGELVRYYADPTASRAFLTASVAATDDTCTVKYSVTPSGGAAVWNVGDSASIDGERVLIKVITGPVAGVYTWTIGRKQPEAHGAWAPISKAQCATYRSANKGKVSVSAFEPAPRQPLSKANDRFTLEIELVRSLE